MIFRMISILNFAWHNENWCDPPRKLHPTNWLKTTKLMRLNALTVPVLSVHNLIIWFVLAESSLQIQSKSWFTCAQLLAVGLWWFGNGFGLRYSCVQNRMRRHPWYRLTLSLRLSWFHSHQCQQFQHVSSMGIPTYYAIVSLHWASPVQPRGFPHQQVHHFRVAPLCRDIHRRSAWEPQLTFELTLSSITSIDRRTDCRMWRVETMCGKRCFILLVGSHGCQRHGWTLNPIFSTDTPQNHGSWISRELWRREPEMRNPRKSQAHWSWKNLKFQK